MYIDDPKRPGKHKKVKKQIPAYIPENDALILAKMRKRSYRLDMCLFNLFGIRFGWSSVLGIIPGVGDFADFLLAVALVRYCATVSCGLDATTQSRMYVNCVIDLLVGFVPLLGDLADAAFKANTRNVRLLEKRLDAAYKPRAVVEAEESTRKQKRASGIHGWEPAPATAYEDYSDEEDERRAFIREQDRADRVRRPEPARTRDEGRAGGGGWFSGIRGGSAKRGTDVERGEAAPRQPPRPDRGYDDQETGTIVNGRR